MTRGRASEPAREAGQWIMEDFKSQVKGPELILETWVSFPGGAGDQ